MNKPPYRDRCRTIMLRAQAFHNEDTIRALFVMSDLLREHANYLEFPGPPSPSKNVDAVLAYLTRYPAREVELLIELLRLLYDRTPDSSIQTDIRTMQTELEKLRRAELVVGEIAQHMREIMIKVPELYTYPGVLTIFALGEGLCQHTAFVPSTAMPNASQQIDSVLVYLLRQSNARDLLRELLALLLARTADQALLAQMRKVLALLGPTPQSRSTS